MATDTFKASVQYNDLTGSAAADRADTLDASAWLKERGLINDDELLVGCEIYVGQLSTGTTGGASISTTFLLAQASNMDSFSSTIDREESVSLRKVDRDFSPDEFFRLFKRFNVTLSSGGLLEDREYSYTENDA